MVTAAVTNGLAPLVEGVGEGIGLLHVLNSTALLAVAPTMLPSAQNDPADAAVAPATSSVALTLRDGSAAWGTGQELVLSLVEEGGGGEGAVGGAGGESGAGVAGVEGSSPPSPPPPQQQQQQKQKRGSARYDFLVLWSALSKITAEGVFVAASDGAATGATGAIRIAVAGEDVGEDKGEGVVEVIRKGFHGGQEGQGKGEGETGGQGEGRGSGPAGGHVVGELRPLSEFSAARQEALDEVRDVCVVCAFRLGCVSWVVALFR